MWSSRELTYCVKYPFSERTKEIARYLNFDLDAIDPKVLERAKQRAREGIEGNRITPEITSANEKILLTEILSYPVAKILIALTKDRFLIKRYAQAEANSFQRFLINESPEVVASMAKEFGIVPKDGVLPFTTYLNAIPKGTKYKLSNTPLKAGKVMIGEDTLVGMLSQRLRQQLESDLREAIDAPKMFETYASELKKEVSREKAFESTEEFGPVQPGLFPPCISALVEEMQSGDPMPHQPRFVLASFLANVNMPLEQVIGMFANTPNFNEKKTRYYIEYSMGKRGSGTKYSPPSCEKMVYYGLCRNKDQLCSRIRHPLSYYSKKKKGWKA